MQLFPNWFWYNDKVIIFNTGSLDDVMLRILDQIAVVNGTRARRSFKMEHIPFLKIYKTFPTSPPIH
jgi:hypothetical protein